MLKHGDTVWVGLGGRTNAAGVEQLAALLGPGGAQRGRRPGQQGAAPEVRGDRAARTARSSGSSPWSTTPRCGRRSCRCPRNPAGTSCVLDADTVLMSSAAPRSRALLEARGLRVVAVDISEFEKLEGCVTCLSVRLRG